MIWNNDTKRLEFEDGTPVGALALNEALAAKGKRAKRDHLKETPQCAARRVEEDVQVKNLKGRLDRNRKKPQWQTGNGINKPRDPSRQCPVQNRASSVYRAGILDTVDY